MYMEGTCGELWSRLLSDDTICILNCSPCNSVYRLYHH